MSSSNQGPAGHHRGTSGEVKTSRAACVNCHSRKIRCDAHKRGFPCSNCISSQRPNCRIHEKKKRSLVRTSHNPVPILKRPESQSNSALLVSTNQRPPFPLPNQAVVPSFPPEAAGGLISSTEADDKKAPTRHLVEFVDRKDMQDSVLRGARITYVGKDVSNINFLLRQRDGVDDESINHLPSDVIARQYAAHSGPERIPREAFMLPEQALADELVNAYFTLVNPWCPIVEEDVFMAHYNAQNPEDPPSLLVLQAILLVGAHVSQPRESRDILKATFFQRAKMLYDARLEKNRDIVVQAALLLTWYSDGTEDIGANAWYWVGIAARTATGLGMHRHAGENNLIHHDMRTWRRIWWILVQFDITVSLFYGRPQAINLDECDVQPLVDFDFEECGRATQKEYVMKRTELCILISKVLRERFGLRVSHEDRRQALGRADEALADWCLNLPASLQMKSTEMRIWVSSLHLMYNNFLILLHRPHPRASKSDDRGPNDSDICNAAANTIAGIFEDLRAKNKIKYLWISDINSLFTAMLQVSVELRLSNPVLALNALRRFDSSLLALRELAEYWTNAEGILRLFEESSHIQHGIRLGKDIKEEDQMSRPNRANGDQNVNTHIASRTDGSQSSIGSNTQEMVPELQTLPENAHNDPITDASPLQQAGIMGWRDFIPPPNQLSPHDFAMGELTPAESEWREIYWQEPGIQGSFGDRMWGWP